MPCYLRLVLWSRDTYQAIIVYITGCMDRLSHACLTTDWQFSNRSRSSQTDFWVKSTGTNLKERFKVDLFASLSFHNPLCHCLSYTFYEVKKKTMPSPNVSLFLVLCRQWLSKDSPSGEDNEKTCTHILLKDRSAFTDIMTPGDLLEKYHNN